jgi:ubiquinol-cytochrome c reductase cytochrome c subunit
MLTILALSSASAQTQEESAASESSQAGAVENGSKIYVSYGCYQCHGYAGQGSTRSGPRIAPDPIAFALFSYIVREPPDVMPGYTEKIVSDEELADIYAFLKTVPQPPNVESIPQLQ